MTARTCLPDQIVQAEKRILEVCNFDVYEKTSDLVVIELGGPLLAMYLADVATLSAEIQWQFD